MGLPQNCLILCFNWLITCLSAPHKGKKVATMSVLFVIVRLVQGLIQKDTQ